GSSRTIDVHIRRIRATLAQSDYEYIHTARGLGYRFEAWLRETQPNSMTLTQPSSGELP
ncbi:MAG: two-component system, OmpR family, response regulator RegX3, partial [Rubrobacteraceae bacterium]|nr:two-component system, OmpR family, response regulator RegX3 [Rubrobacteraceae bacterium]